MGSDSATYWPPLKKIITDTRRVLDDKDWHSNLFGNRIPALNPLQFLRFGEIKNKQVPQDEIFTFVKPREHLGLASISFPGTGGCVDATQDLASASQIFQGILLKHILRNNLGLENNPPQLQP